ncbi:MAG TPA: hypothetical protein VLT45_15125 [Kofleriaceae bacterium]|nr:hypothetical protein [Kofleriaceae bacterium]
MSGLLRPKFSEGQILGAADLTALVVYDQQGSVYHESTEHLWGVAQGLSLTPKDNTTTSETFVDVSLSPGRAVDRLGRSIVITDAIPLDPSDFVGQIANPDKTKLYPVFVQALDVEKPGETQPGKCGVTLATRTEESFQVSYGYPGSEKSTLDQPAATIDHVFDTPGLNDMVLVGWVQFDPALASGQGRFIGVATQANGSAIRYVGVVASDVVAGGGTLTLHTRPDGSRFAVSISEDGKGGCKLQFGKQDGSNPITSAVTLDEQGNITYTGKLSPAPIAGLQAESGTTTDGMRLPLPVGVTEDDVRNEKVQLFMFVMPLTHLPTSMLLPSGHKDALPFLDCSVDPGTRTVTSVVRWADPAHAASVFVVRPNPCRYLIIANGG